MSHSKLATIADQAKLFELMPHIHGIKPKHIQDFINRGADVNIRWRGTSPLHVACMYRDNPKIVKILIESGADINAMQKDNKCTPLALAVSAGHPKIAFELLQYGPELNRKDNEGKTLLDIATDFVDYINYEPAFLERRYLAASLLLLHHAACKCDQFTTDRQMDYSKIPSYEFCLAFLAEKMGGLSDAKHMYENYLNNVGKLLEEDSDCSKNKDIYSLFQKYAGQRLALLNNTNGEELKQSLLSCKESEYVKIPVQNPKFLWLATDEFPSQNNERLRMWEGKECLRITSSLQYFMNRLLPFCRDNDLLEFEVFGNIENPTEIGITCHVNNILCNLEKYLNFKRNVLNVDPTLKKAFEYFEEFDNQEVSSAVGNFQTSSDQLSDNTILANDKTGRKIWKEFNQHFHQFFKPTDNNTETLNILHSLQSPRQRG